MQHKKKSAEWYADRKRRKEIFDSRYTWKIRTTFDTFQEATDCCQILADQGIVPTKIVQSGDDQWTVYTAVLKK